MTILNKLEKLFNGEIEEMTLKEVLDVPPETSIGQLTLSCQVRENNEEVTIDFVKRDGRWIVTGYQHQVRG